LYYLLVARGWAVSIDAARLTGSVFNRRLADTIKDALLSDFPLWHIYSFVCLASYVHSSLRFPLDAAITQTLSLNNASSWTSSSSRILPRPIERTSPTNPRPSIQCTQRLVSEGRNTCSTSAISAQYWGGRLVTIRHIVVDFGYTRLPYEFSRA
jgi:hypothetical protein